jgi:hypothetical protein
MLIYYNKTIAPITRFAETIRPLPTRVRAQGRRGIPGKPKEFGMKTAQIVDIAVVANDKLKKAAQESRKERKAEPVNHFII